LRSTLATALHMPIPRKAARAGGVNQQKVKAAGIFRRFG
jgi:hypothetical protein